MQHITTVIPLRYNDGREVESEKVELIKNSIIRISGGLSEHRTAGIWESDTGERFTDESLTLEVDVPSHRHVRRIKKIIEHSKGILQQEAMYFSVERRKVTFI